MPLKSGDHWKLFITTETMPLASFPMPQQNTRGSFTTSSSKFSKRLKDPLPRLAKASQRTSSGFYFVLIILTNGNLKSGLQDSMDTIVQASELPISVVFVAIGNKKRPGVNCSKLNCLLSPTLKSSSNTPLARETATMV